MARLRVIYTGRLTRIATAHRKLLSIMKARFAAPGPSPVKAALNLKGINVGDVRIPMVPLIAEETNTLQSVLQQLG
ncbi:hypothetical protein EDM56_02390 [Brevibacillus fluminis]|uniref:4-hydroxy-tetrahydrodipicolinate synthase n=2 Tax=Brevibacillus fluminis TaxID=511487 RepID=A0A3M8DTX4_9BACL|nr:hypothetical protein EDM56_02390 [Brevibacillus fluminis]